MMYLILPQTDDFSKLFQDERYVVKNLTHHHLVGAKLPEYLTFIRPLWQN